MRIARFSGLWVVCIFFLLSFAAWAGEVVRVGVSLSLSGPNQEWGKRTLAGVRMRLEEWVLSGKRPLVELVIRDDGNDKAKSRKNVRDLVEKEKVKVLIGPGMTQFILAEREYLKANKVVAITPNSTNSEIGGRDDWIFRLMFDDAFQGRAIAEYAYGELNLRRAAVVVNTAYPYSELVSAAFSEAFEKLGGETVRKEKFYWRYSASSVFDFRPIFTSIAASGVDAVLLPLLAPEVADFLNDSRGVDFDAVFLGTDTWESESLMEAGGGRLKKAYYVSGLGPESGTPEMEHFLSRYNVSNEAYAAVGSVFGYDAMSVVLHALEGVEGVSASEEIRERFFGLREYPLASGRITIDPERGTLRPAYIRRVVKESRWFKSTYEGTVGP